METENIIKTLEAVDELSEQINLKESDCLVKIFTRFCLLHGLLIDFDQIRRKNFSERPNYWEYWYKYGTKQQFFLMSRELLVNDNVPALNIVFSKALTKDNEL